ncbi:hypothetical protein BGZ80_008927 [Entomortierella chlamydospora]|uniref:Myb-like domain-containing protein n=1 Tax=Entomortierella chlamydospora TaxID=101097 RepID=A0A9P6T0U2_9FUNG|nr:hypothetical protein BGZ80_008927 [Entomortierella chlamydospora]
MARARSTQPPLPSSEDAKENLRRLSQRIHQRRTRARETILYDLHQGVKTVEAQVQKQVDMVLSKIKDAPGSKYAFALTHTFLTQLPQALSNTILPSAISAVADTVAGRTTNSLTTLRGRAGLDEFDEEEEDEEEDDEMDDLDDSEELGYQQQIATMKHHLQQDSQLSSDFRTIALASPPLSPSDNNANGWSSSSREDGGSSYNSTETRTVSISSAGASEFLAASTHHDYSTAASQVLNAALPSFIPSMVAPIVCVFSYQSPSTKSNNSGQSSTSAPTLLASIKGKGVARQQQQQQEKQDQEVYDDIRVKQEEQDFDLQAATKAGLGIAAATSNAWTSAEREALYLAATRFRLRGQWAKIREMMCLRHTDKEIENEYQRLYGESADEDDDSDVETEDGDVDRNQAMQQQQQQQQVTDNDLLPVKMESDVDDADDEADTTVFMKFGSLRRDSRTSCTLVPIEPFRAPESVSRMIDDQSLPTAPEHARVNEKPLQVMKEFMVDKRFQLEEIPLRL